MGSNPCDSSLLLENRNKVILWEFDFVRTKKLQDRKIKPFEAGLCLPDDLIVTNGFESFKDYEAVLFVVPSQYMRYTCELLKTKVYLLMENL